MTEECDHKRTRLAGGAVRGEPGPSAGGRLPHARLNERGRRRRSGGLASSPARPRDPERLTSPSVRIAVAIDGRGAAVHTIPRVRLRFWGTRGSVAAAGPETVRYGGNA